MKMNGKIMCAIKIFEIDSNGSENRVPSLYKVYVVG